MKSTIKIAIVSAFTFAAAAANAYGGMQTYKLRVTNGSGMPISPAVVYVKNGLAPLTNVGQMPSAGFTRLCQTGSPDDRLMEIKSSASVEFAEKTSGLLMPGQSIEISVPAANGPNRSIHFEAMYGKTKDACAVFSTGTDALNMAPAGVVLTGRDEVLSSGAFLDPAVPKDMNQACMGSASAVDCLRELAMPAANGMAAVRFFPGYLPSVTHFLEERFGAADAQTLVIPASGAVRFQITK